MIPRSKVIQVALLLRTGLSLRQVAKLSGVSRSTVTRLQRQRYKTERSDDRIVYFVYFDQSYKRCPKCGAKVKVPCLKCHVDGLRTAKPRIDDLLTAA